MSFHLAAFYKNVAVSSGYTEILPIADAELTINPATTRFWSSQDVMVFAAYAGGTSLTRARLYTPWRQPNHVRPINPALLPGDNPGLAQWLKSPMIVPATHEIIMDVNHGNAAAQDIVGLMLLTTDGLTRLPAGQLQTVRGDVSGAAPGVRLWSEVTVSWEYALPPGDYAIVGSECVSTNAIAHRWILESSSSRPGAVSQVSLTTLPTQCQMGGELGAWGMFTSPVMPRLEVLCNAADATHTVFLQVIAL